MFLLLTATFHGLLGLGNFFLGLIDVRAIHPVLLAATFIVATANDAFGIGRFLMRFVNLLSGPVAQTFSYLLIISCAIPWYRGHEGREWQLKLVGVGIAIVLLANMVGIWVHFHGSSGIGI